LTYSDNWGKLTIKIREIVIYLYMFVFFLGLTSTTTATRETQPPFLFGFFFLVGVCGVILANWVHVDGKRIEELAAKIEELEKRVQRQ
jgi:hypothetical protein